MNNILTDEMRFYWCITCGLQTSRAITCYRPIVVRIAVQYVAQLSFLDSKNVRLMLH